MSPRGGLQVFPVGYFAEPSERAQSLMLLWDFLYSHLPAPTPFPLRRVLYCLLCKYPVHTLDYSTPAHRILQLSDFNAELTA